MNGWPLINLGEACEFVLDGTHGSPIRTDSGVPVLSAQNVINGALNFNTDRYTSEKEYQDFRRRLDLNIGDVLLTIVGTIGRVAIVKELRPLVFQRSVGILRPKEKLLDSSYLFHALCRTETELQLNKITNTSAQAGVYLSKLKTIEIPLPTLIEQKRIAAILDKADAIRRKRQQSIKLADNFLRATFLDMFGDPVENPMGWKIEKLDNISTKICSGTTPVGGEKVYVEQGVTFLRSQNVWRRKIELDDVAYIDNVTHKRMAKTSLKNRDILITKTGRINTENSSLGRAALFTGEDDSANINGHVYLIRLKPKIINEFVLYIITTNEYRDYIRSVCVGGIDKRQINKEHLEQFPIIAPPVQDQQRFIKILHTVEKQKVALNKQIQLANEMFFSLTQRAFRGEL